jgi:hypothetical protein
LLNQPQALSFRRDPFVRIVNIAVFIPSNRGKSITTFSKERDQLIFLAQLHG